MATASTPGLIATSVQALDKFVATRLSDHRARTPEGYLICLGVPIARTGYQTYRASEVDRDGSLGLTGLIDLYRPKREVLSAATVASFEGKSTVSPHPPVFLNVDNDSAYAKGHAQHVRPSDSPMDDGEWALLADLIIKDPTLIQQIEAGHRYEISCGYTYDIEQLPDGKYAQTNIRGNHVAIVASGRAGSGVRILDSKPGDIDMELADVKGVFDTFKDIFSGMGWRPPVSITATDAESETVARQKKLDEDANKLKERTMDGTDAGHPDADKTQKEEAKLAKDANEKVDKEDKGATPPDKKDEPGAKAKDEAETEAEKKKEKKAEDARQATDAKLSRIADALETLIGRDAAQCDCDAKDGEPHDKSCPMFKKEAKDQDLIPVATLPSDERPDNPIPGADAALEHLRSIRPLIAQSGDRQAIDAYNGAVRELKGGSGDGSRRGTDGGNGGYGSLTRMRKPEEVINAEARAHVRSGTDARDDDKPKEDFVDVARKFHRKNASDVGKSA